MAGLQVSRDDPKIKNVKNQNCTTWALIKAKVIRHIYDLTCRVKLQKNSLRTQEIFNDFMSVFRQDGFGVKLYTIKW